MCRFHRRPAKSTRTRLVRLFKKGERPLCPLEMRFGRLRDCGLGTEWSVPFFEPGMSLAPVGKIAGKLDQLELILFCKPGTEVVCSVCFSGFAGLRGRPGFLQWRPTFSSFWSTNSGGL